MHTRFSTGAFSMSSSRTRNPGARIVGVLETAVVEERAARLHQVGAHARPHVSGPRSHAASTTDPARCGGPRLVCR
jgi:hypothetical protein